MQTNYLGDTSEVSELSAQIHKFQHELEQLKKDYTQTMVERNSFLLEKESLQDEVLRLTIENAELKGKDTKCGYCEGAGHSFYETCPRCNGDGQMTLDLKPTKEDEDV